MSEKEKIIGLVKKYKQNTNGYNIELCEIIIEHPEIMLQKETPDTDILYYYMKKKNIVVTELSLYEFKKGTMSISTIRNFRKKLRDYLEENGVALEIAQYMRKKGAVVRERINNYMI